MNASIALDIVLLSNFTFLVATVFLLQRAIGVSESTSAAVESTAKRVDKQMQVLDSSTRRCLEQIQQFQLSQRSFAVAVTALINANNDQCRTLDTKLSALLEASVAPKQDSGIGEITRLTAHLARLQNSYDALAKRHEEVQADLSKAHARARETSATNVELRSGLEDQKSARARIEADLKYQCKQLEVENAALNAQIREFASSVVIPGDLAANDRQLLQSLADQFPAGADKDKLAALTLENQQLRTAIEDLQGFMGRMQTEKSFIEEKYLDLDKMVPSESHGNAG